MTATCAACGKVWKTEPGQETSDSACPYCRTQIGVTRLVRSALTPADLTQSQLDGAPPDLETALADPGCRFDRYVRVHLLGRGGMGEVWKAWDLELRRWVALKFPVVETPEDLQLLKREAQAAARLSHPNLAAVHEFASARGRSFIVMQYVDGITLSEHRVDDRNSLIRILQRVAEAVGHAHALGMLHRDLKPGNILIERGTGRPFVMDFGIARAIASQRTVTGTIMGTPAYMSPEQAAGRRLDPRSDIWSLGVILYELVTGRLPFDATTPGALLAQTERAPLEIPRGLPGDLAAVLAQSLERDPSRRYSTASDLAADLERFLAGEPVAATPLDALRRLRSAVVRRRILIGFAASALLGVAAVAVFLLPRMRRAERELALKNTLAPYQMAIEEAQRFFYIPGDDFLQKRDEIEAALRKLESLAEDPEWASYEPLWSTIGRGWHFLGDDDRAEKALLKAYAFIPGDPQLNLSLGRIYLHRCVSASITSGRDPAEVSLKSVDLWSQRAKDYLEHAFSHHESSWEMEWFLATTCFALAENDPEKTRQRCTQGLEKFGNRMGTEELWMLQALVLRFRDAIEACTRAIERRPHYAWAYFYRGLLREKEGQCDQAILDYSEALRIQPNYTDAWMERGIAKTRAKDPWGAIQDHSQAVRLRPNHARNYLNRGASYLNAGDHDKALEDFNRALSLDPDYSIAYVNRSKVWLHQKDYRRAKTDLDTALRLSPHLASAWLNRGVCSIETGDWKSALSDYNRVLELDPSHEVAYFNRGNLWKELRNWEQAAADYSTAIRVNPNYEEAYFRRGVTFLQTENWTQAEADFTAAIRINPKDADAWNNRSLAFLNQRKTDEALSDANQAIQVEPGSAAAYVSRGQAKESKGDIAGAISDLTEAIRLHSDNADYYCERGRIRQSIDRENARRDYDKALALNPAHTTALLKRGNLRLDSRDREGARTDFESLVQINPENPIAYGSRALVRMEMEDNAGAVEDLERALKLAPADWTFKEQTEQMLQEARRRLQNSYGDR